MKKYLLFPLLVVSLISLSSCGEADPIIKTESSTVSLSSESESSDSLSFSTDDTINNSNNDDDNSLNYQIEGEENAKNYPAEAGSILYDKNDAKFKGMNYFFEGEIIGNVKLKNFTSGEAWLVKNSNGYVMPIEYSYFTGSKGDIVKVWGTLSGLQFSNSDLNVDNVVGATGSIHAMGVEINGETQY